MDDEYGEEEPLEDYNEAEDDALEFSKKFIRRSSS